MELASTTSIHDKIIKIQKLKDSAFDNYCVKYFNYPVILSLCKVKLVDTKSN